MSHGTERRKTRKYRITSHQRSEINSLAMVNRKHSCLTAVTYDIGPEIYNRLRRGNITLRAVSTRDITQQSTWHHVPQIARWYWLPVTHVTQRATNSALLLATCNARKQHLAIWYKTRQITFEYDIQPNKPVISKTFHPNLQQTVIWAKIRKRG